MRYAELCSKDRLGRVTAGLVSFLSLLLTLAWTAKSVSGQVVLPHDGIISTVAGNGTQGYSGDAGPATGATLNSPRGIAIDSSGNIYIADSPNNVIRKVSASTGVISTVAGNGTQGYSGDGASATSAELDTPVGIAVDSAGNIYIADMSNNVIRKVTVSTGVITTVAGAADDFWGGYSGDGGSATDATFADPASVALDSSGNIYIADMFNNVIRKVTVSTGIITTVAGNGSSGYSGDGGAATSAELNLPTYIAVDSAGNIYIADLDNQVIRKVVASTGIISTVAGNGVGGYSGDGGPATSAMLGYPEGVAVDGVGNLYISESGNSVIRKVTASTGIISTVVGNGLTGYSGDGDLATAATLTSPSGVAVVPSPGYYLASNLYILDQGNNVVRVVGAYRVAAPTFSPISATYATPQTVTISDSLSGATIYYTTDGTTPTTSSHLYSGPITIGATEILSAVAATSGGLLTATGTAPYTITQVTPEIDYSSGFTSSGLNLVNATIVSGGLQLSDGNLAEERAAWYTTPVNSQSFTSDFDYQITSPVADGITFVIQNSSDGQNAVGEFGEELGYGTIDSSVAIKFDFYNNYGEGTDSTGFYTNGDSPTLPALDMTTSGLLLNGGNLMHVHVIYDGITLTWTISDTVTKANYTASTAVDIPSIVGGDTAYVGFTGATGTFTSTQSVPNWTYISGTATTFAATPVFSPPGGTYSSSQTVTISDATPGTTIYYTADGSTPTISSTLYTGAVTAGVSETLKAIAIASGYYNSAIGSAAYTISSPIVVSVTPLTATLSGGQTQQFSATVTNSSNTTVIWSISPSGAGTVSSTGLYTAPSSITMQQTVTITATSQADTSKSASATISLAPPCVPSDYSYRRSISIDHTKIPNTDQSDFPLFFNTTDPLFATTSNGGHVNSTSGYDIVFASDAACTQRLNFEIETWDRVTGQLASWVQIPTLSHTTDTTIFLCYGNSSISTDQSNSTAVWDTAFEGVYHLQSSAGSVSVLDSTANGNSGLSGNNSIALPSIETGVFGIDAASFNGSQGISLPSLAISNFTVSGWINPTISGETGAFLAGSPGNMEARTRSDNTLNLLKESAVDMGASSSLLTINSWNHVAISYDGTTAKFFINGVPKGTNVNAQTFNVGNYFIGMAGNGENFRGGIEELHLSSSIRSGDWIATEYNNQSSPSTFSLLSSEAGSVSPAAVTLYASQSQQFTVPTLAVCGVGTATWLITPAGVGTISASGLYVAPAVITTSQTVTITATNSAGGAQIQTATVTLLPPVAVSLTPATVTLYDGSQSQQFAASVVNTSNTAVTWTISPAGAGTISASGLYTAPAGFTTLQIVTVTATSQSDATKSDSSTITLSPQSPSSTQCAVTGYNYKRAIAIDHTQVPHVDEANFPFMFSATDPVFASIANGGHVSNSLGYDIFFSTDPAGLTKLDHEVEEYDPVTGHLIAWVRIPTLSHSENTILYMFYGNPGITAPQQNPAGVWDKKYQGVYHLANVGSGAAVDSTANANSAPVTSVLATPGRIDGAGAFDGVSSYMQLPSANFVAYPNDGQDTTNYSASFGAWFKTGSSGVILGQTAGGVEPGGFSGGFVPALYVDNAGYLRAQFFNLVGSAQIVTSTAYNDNVWHFATLTYEDGIEALYVDGQNVGSRFGAIQNFYSSSYSYFVGTGHADGWAATNGSSWFYFNGSIDNVSVSDVARSADWVQTEYFNQSSPSTFFTLYPEDSETLIPAAVTLYAKQFQQFLIPSACGSVTAVWSMPTGALGTLSASGLYTAPANIDSQQAVTITASTLGVASTTLSATVTLMPPVAVSMTPPSAVLYGGQTQQFTANVSHTSNTAVIWTMDPASVGSISASGLYSAPSSITTQQIVTITATSQADTNQSASATLTLVPASFVPNPPSSTQCGSGGYSYQRAIVINHTKVPNSDQVNFPFLFNTIDADLATTANGGHVVSSNGYDIIFSTDPNGLTKLDHEVEQYNPITGQLIAWIRIPTLSHISDTVIYMFYGNSNVVASQQNPNAVWDSNYQAVYHLASTASNTATDSTEYAHNGTLTSVSSASGLIDGDATFNATSSYIQVPSTAFPSYPVGQYSDLGLPTNDTSTQFAASFGAWFKTSGPGAILGQVPSQFCTLPVFSFCIGYASTVPGDYDPSGWLTFLYIDTNGHIEGDGGMVSPQVYNDNNWHHVVLTYDTNDTSALYVDGQRVATGTNYQVGYSADYNYFVGTGYTFLENLGNWDWLYFNGSLDEVDISDIARSADWIRTEYNNQGSPSTFYTLSSIGSVQIEPQAISLYASQTQQFAVGGMCNTDAHWTMPSGALGTLTSAGLYTAPSSLSSQQTVTITATKTSDSSTLGSASITLLPPVSQLTLTAAATPPYTTGTTQSFTATLRDDSGSPEVGVSITFSVAGQNSNIGNATTDNDGSARFSYIGASNGTDTIRATAVADGEPLASNSISASWILPTGSVPSAGVSVKILPQIGLGGLVGAFTDSSGAVIEPVALGAAPTKLVVPTGATQLQLGINDEYFEDNSGTGFIVTVDGASVTVPPTAMPWTWITGGLNNGYQYGVKEGTSPVIAAVSLTAGQTVAVAYQSGTVSTNFPLRPFTNADGDQNSVTGVGVTQGTYFPTLYMSASSYPIGQPTTVTAIATNDTGSPLTGAIVTLNVTGANPAQLTATTDSTGTALFEYVGMNSGSDTLQAQVTATGGSTLSSSDGTIAWVSYPMPPAVGSLALSYFAVVNNVQQYNVLASDASGAAVANSSVGFYVSGADNLQFSAVTDITGHTTLGYYHVNSGVYNVLAVTSIGRNVILSTPVTGTWTPGSSTTTGTSNQINVSVSAQNTLTLPNTLQLNGTVTDNIGITPVIAWSQISGPDTVTFADPTQAVTTASFTEAGNYVLQLTGSDTGVSSSVQINVLVSPVPVPQIPQGWVGSPVYGSAVSGLVPITLAPGVNLASGTLEYYPVNNPTNVVILNSNTTGSGQIGVLDTTALVNGTYLLHLQSTQTNGDSEQDVVLVTVIGDYKPGRVTSTVTDLVVPATGLAINIQRTYDSLNASASSDFGYGWSLGTTVDLTVDPKGDVTFTLGGQRKTFYLAPQTTACGPSLIGCIFLQFYPHFTPEPGMRGTLTDGGTGCGVSLDILVIDGGLWECVGGAPFVPTQYVYTDPNGTQYNISANGNLQSITDRVGNSLSITPAGITSTTGLSVPFVRDTLGRITQITDPQGHIYQYAYDASGNLSTVTYPNTTHPSTYTYDVNHLYLSGTDFRNNPLPSSSYYTATDTDASGNSLAGRLQSVTDGLGETTGYAYNLATNTTTVRYPQDASGNVGTSTLAYDNLGNLLSTTDPLGHTTTNTYDSNRNLLSVRDPLGHTTSYTYDPNGNKTSSTYPATATSTNTTSTTVYNQYSEPTSTTDELGNVRAFNYDGNYNPQSVTDSAGTLASFLFNADSTLAAGAIGYDITAQPSKASQFAYDLNGNLIGRTDALGRVTSYTYDSLGRKVMMVQPPLSGSSTTAATTTYQYDTLGNLTQTAAPLGRTTSSQFDANGNKTSDTDALGHITSYQYDALNRLTTTTYPTSPATTSSRTYDFRGNVVNETDQAGNVTHHVYDLAGRQTSVTRAYGTSNASTTTYTYYADGKKETETDALSHTTTYTYDAASNLTAIAGVKGNLQYSYDNARNQTSMTDANGHTTAYQFDARKRLTQTTYPDLTTKINAYDGPGNLVSVTDQAGNLVQYTYDAANQLKTVVQANSPNTGHNTNTYGYDNGGNLAGLSDENGHTTQNAFDLLYRLTAKTLPDGSLTESRSYDAAGNLVSLTHFNGKTTTYSYDGLNRLLTRTPDPTLSEPTVSFTYTATGKRHTMVDDSGTTTYSYDSFDRLTTKATPEGTLNYTYDAAGNLASMSSSHSNGISVEYTYDDLNRLSTVVDNRLGSGANTTTYTYDPASNLATATYPNGLQSAFSYDSLNRVSTLVSSVSGYAYQYGPTGNRSTATEINGRTLTWSYDGINRLTNETIASAPSGKNGSVAYSLDPVGNRLSDSSSLSGVSSSSSTFDADDRLSNETYDANGNTLATNGKSFSYDSENRLTSMNGGAVTIRYDGDGNRFAKTVGGVTTHYLVDDLNPTGYAQVVEELVGGAVQREYTYGLQRIDENQVISSTWTPSFYGYDGAGSVRQLTNTAGAVTDTYDYDAFGNKINSTGSTPNSYLYRGEAYDSDLGLYYLRARYMNPLTGRFMSRDPEDGKPIDPKTLHKYLYAGGDPINRFDPRGREIEEEGEIDAISELELATRPARQEAAFNGCMEGVLELLSFTHGFDVATGDTLLPAYEIAKGICVVYAAAIP